MVVSDCKSNHSISFSFSSLSFFFFFCMVLMKTELTIPVGSAIIAMPMKTRCSNLKHLIVPVFKYTDSNYVSIDNKRETFSCTI